MREKNGFNKCFDLCFSRVSSIYSNWSEFLVPIEIHRQLSFGLSTNASYKHAKDDEQFKPKRASLLNIQADIETIYELE